jgi:hypothetical protein
MKSLTALFRELSGEANERFDYSGERMVREWGSRLTTRTHDKDARPISERIVHSWRQRN